MRSRVIAFGCVGLCIYNVYVYMYVNKKRLFSALPLKIFS